MQWPSKARASPSDRFPSRQASAVRSGAAGQWSGLNTSLCQREIGRKARGTYLSTVLDLRPYRWHFAALQSRCTIELRPGVQRSSPYACEQRDKVRASEDRAA